MKKRIYLDFAAGTPVDKNVLKGMTPYFSERFGNPGSLHSFGQEAIAAIDRSREILAAELQADFRNIIFTSSATEANNLAIRGVVEGSREYFTEKKINGRPKILVSAVEHESVLNAARSIKGVEVEVLPVDNAGRLDLEAFRSRLDARAVLVSVMFGNNETGALEPVAEIGKIISEFRKDAPYPLLHSDAAQAWGYSRIIPRELGIDLLTLSSQKVYGPKGAGALYINKEGILSPIIFGGEQEFGLRSGTENVPAITGFALAVAFAAKLRDKEGKRVRILRDYLWRETKKAFRGVEINGTMDKKMSLPHILNMRFPGMLAEESLSALDLQGFAVSSGSACKSRRAEPSYVLKAMGRSEEEAKEALRISLGRTTSKADIRKLIKTLKKLK